MAVRSHRKSKSQRILVPTTVNPFYRKAATATVGNQGVRLEEVPCPKGAISIADLKNLPSNRLEALHGDRAGQFSIRINRQWRICFTWPTGEPGPSNVEIVDYH